MNAKALSAAPATASIRWTSILSTDDLKSAMASRLIDVLPLSRMVEKVK
jgi:hypothetical protein